MGLRIVEKFHDEAMPFEDLLDDSPLDAAAAPVDQAHLAQTCCVGLRDVLFDDRGNIPRVKRMKIQRTLDGNVEGILVGQRYFS